MRIPGWTLVLLLPHAAHASIAAFFVSAAGASYMASIKGSAAMGFAIPFAACAALSVLHARSMPRGKA